jgi:hypothetical protein
MHGGNGRGRYARRATGPVLAMVAAMALAVAAACGSTATMTTTTSTPGRASPPPAGCGDSVAGWVSTDAPLAMTASFPARAPAGGAEMLRGTVTVTNRSDSHLSGTGAAQPDVTLARDGKVVALPLGLRLVAAVIELAPGAGQSFEAVASLRPCDAGADRQARLRPGSYQVFASQRFDIDPAGPNRRQVVARGGPWDLTLT